MSGPTTPSGHDGRIDTPDAPPDDADAGMEGHLGDLTDEEWLRGHRALMASGDIPEAELAYLYDPDRDPATVTVDDLTTSPDPKEPSDG